MAILLWNYDLDDACYRARLMAALAGVPVELRNIDMFPGREHRSPAMLALNPQGRLPVLQEGPLTLVQTEAILLHLARQTERGRSFIPADPIHRALMEDWLVFAARDLGAAAAARATAMLGAAGDGPALRRAARDALRLVEDHLTARGHAGEGFVAGRAASVADVALFPAFALSRDYAVDHDAFPALRLWARRIRALPGFVTMPGIPDYH